MSGGERFGWWAIVDEPWGFRIVQPGLRRRIAAWLGLAVIGAALAVVGHATITHPETRRMLPLATATAVFFTVVAATELKWRGGVGVAHGPARPRGAPARMLDSTRPLVVRTVEAAGLASDRVAVATTRLCVDLPEQPRHLQGLAQAIGARLGQASPQPVGKRWTMVAAADDGCTVHIHDAAPPGLDLTLALLPFLAFGTPLAFLIGERRGHVATATLALVIVTTMFAGRRFLPSFVGPPRMLRVTGGALHLAWWERGSGLDLSDATALEPVAWLWKSDLRLHLNGRWTRLRVWLDRKDALALAEAIWRLRPDLRPGAAHGPGPSAD